MVLRYFLPHHTQNADGGRDVVEHHPPALSHSAFCVTWEEDPAFGLTVGPKKRGSDKGVSLMCG